MAEKKVAHLGLLYVAVIVLSFWLVGFVSFIIYTFNLKYLEQEQADAIVVLTGGDGRIKTGLELLSEGKGELLLISGVNKSVSENMLFKELSPSLRQKITLGYQADNTKGNAKELRNWVNLHHINSILLVTSFYHMPRSLLEVHSVSGVRVFPYPFFPQQLNESKWLYSRYAWLLFVEYNKYLWVLVSNMVKGL